MKKQLKTWCNEHPDKVALIVCVALGVPLGLWLGTLFYHTVDEPWAVSRRDVTTTGYAVFASFLTLWLILCHCALCVKNRRDPRTYFIYKIKSLKN